MKRIIALLLVLMPIVVSAQEERNLLKDSITQMLLMHPYQFGIFRVGPKLVIDSGYDSNALGISNESILQEQVGDYYTSVAPGGSFALKLGRRGYFTIDEDVNFLYYNKLDALRDIYNTTQAQFVTGTRKLLFTAGGLYLKKKDRVNSEFDQPARVQTAGGHVDVDFAIRPRTDLTFDLMTEDKNYERISGVLPTQPLPPDNTETNYGGGIEELFGRNMRFKVHGGKGYTDFRDRLPTEQLDRTNNWDVDSGFEFTGVKFNGHAGMGYEQRESRIVGDPSLKNITVDADLNWLLRHHLAFNVFARRLQEPSNLTAQGFRLTTEGGARASLPLTERFFVDGGYTIGKNDYNGGQLISKDNYQEGLAGLDFVLIQNLVLRGGLDYYKRDSDFLLFNKNRTTFTIGIRYNLQSTEPH